MHIEITILLYTVATNIKMILTLDIPSCLSLFILDDPLLKHLPAPQADWVQTSLIVRRKLTVTGWKVILLPPTTVWFSQPGTAAGHEGLSFKLTNQVEKYFAKRAIYSLRYLIQLYDNILAQISRSFLEYGYVPLNYLNICQ